MKKEFTVTSREAQGYLSVTGNGERNTVSDILDSARLLMTELKKYTYSKILLDYSKVRTRAKYADVFNISRIHEEATPELTDYIFAVMVNRYELETETFWEETNRKRGLNTRIFVDKQEAIEWLLNQ